MNTLIVLLGCAFLFSGAVVAHGVIVAYRTPPEREPVDEFVGRAAALTFDEHAAVASALLQPDRPLLSDTPHADALEDWLRTNTNQEF